MERQSKKRGREEKQEEEEEKEKKYSGEKTAKKQQDNMDSEDDDTLNTWESYMPVGVFDFPWLKEGMISKSEDLNLKFEDAFSSSLGETFTTVGVELSSQCLVLSEFPDDKLDDNLWPFQGQGDEGVDGGDCIWSSLLNQPLSTEFIERGV